MSRTAPPRRAADPTHYEVLGVPRNADSDEIRRGFLAMTRRWHAWRDTDKHAHVMDARKRATADGPAPEYAYTNNSGDQLPRPRDQ